jgi:hypothetical protein
MPPATVGRLTPSTVLIALPGGGLLQFLTDEQCRRWLANRWQPDFDRSTRRASIPYSNVASRMHYISRWLASELSYNEPVLLWVTDSNIFPSSSNWHLYYRLRESYGDRRLIDDAPGHLCLNYETQDLATLIYLTRLNAWDASFIPQLDYVSLTFSHDGFIDVFSENAELVEEVRKNASDSPSRGVPNNLSTPPDVSPPRSGE